MRGDGDLGQGSNNRLGDSWLVSGIVSSLEQAGFPRGVRKRGGVGYDLLQHQDEAVGGAALGREIRNWIADILSYRYLLGMQVHTQLI